MTTANPNTSYQLQSREPYNTNINIKSLNNKSANAIETIYFCSAMIYLVIKSHAAMLQSVLNSHLATLLCTQSCSVRSEILLKQMLLFSPKKKKKHLLLLPKRFEASEREQRVQDQLLYILKKQRTAF